MAPPELDLLGEESPLVLGEVVLLDRFKLLNTILENFFNIN